MTILKSTANTPMKYKRVGKFMIGVGIVSGVRVVKVAKNDKSSPDDWFLNLVAEAFGFTGNTPAYGITKAGYNIVSFYW